LNFSKKIINFTPTGTQTTRKNSLAPLSTSEIIDDVLQANEIGITLVHLHARDENLENTYKIEHFSKIIEGIRKSAPELVICTSLTGRSFPELEKRTEVLKLKPDLASLTLSSINFSSGASVNQPDMILKLIEKMNEFGTIPELECFDTGMINMAKYLIEKNFIQPPFYFNVILGNRFNAQCDLSTLADIKNQLPNNSVVTLGGIGNQQLKSNIHGLIEFDGVRIGLEDNFYYKNKQKATNINLLKRIHRIMSELDFVALKPEEFRKIGYENKHFNNR
jgi:uncharacterized protein (DUF849 family)